MKSYGQMIYEAYAREHGLRHTWGRVDPADKEEWDRIGQDVAHQLSERSERAHEVAQEAVRSLETQDD